MILTQDQLVANNVTCPALGITACDNAGECGMCLLELLTCRLPWYGAGVTAEVPEKVKVCSMPLAVWQK